MNAWNVRYSDTHRKELTLNCRFPGLQHTSTPLFGLPRDSDVLKVYADAVDKAKSDCEKLMIKARQGCTQIEEAKVLFSIIVWDNPPNRCYIHASTCSVATLPFTQFSPQFSPLGKIHIFTHATYQIISLYPFLRQLCLFLFHP